MNPRLKYWLLNIFGWIFLVLGILGLVLPGPGILSILIGLYLLSHSSPWAKRLLTKLRQRYPKLAEKSDEFIKKFKWNSTP